MLTLLNCHRGYHNVETVRHSWFCSQTHIQKQHYAHSVNLPAYASMWPVPYPFPPSVSCSGREPSRAPHSVHKVPMPLPLYLKNGSSQGTVTMLKSTFYFDLSFYLIYGELGQSMSHGTLEPGILTRFWYKLPKAHTSLHVCSVLAQDSQS